MLKSQTNIVYWFDSEEATKAKQTPDDTHCSDSFSVSFFLCDNHSLHCQTVIVLALVSIRQLRDTTLLFATNIQRDFCDLIS